MALFVPLVFSGASFPTDFPWPDSITLDFGIRQKQTSNLSAVLHVYRTWRSPIEVAVPCVGLCK